MRQVIVGALIVLIAAPALAHHSYGDILRDQSVSLAGVVEQIEFVNPHVQMQVRADDGSVYSVEWGNVLQMTRTGVRRDTVKKGDRLIVTGSPHRDPARRHLTLLTEIRRPADGWQWTKTGSTQGGTAPQGF
jgi:hypothetical protein